MTAAVRAAELGMDFILVDRGYMPSTARNAIGCVNDRLALENGCTEDRFKMLREMVRYSSGKYDSQLVLNWIDNGCAMFDWVADIAAEYGFSPVMTTDRGVEADPAYYCAATEHRLAAPAEGDFAGMSRHDIFLDYIQQRGYGLMGGYELVRLVKGEQGVEGAVFFNRDTEAYARVTAANTILATGGYADNPEMMEAIHPATCKTLAAWMLYPGNSSQGIKAALWAGADKDDEPAPMIFDRGAVAPGTQIGVTKADDGSYSVPMGYITTADEYNPGTQPFLKVNKRGERFANEAGPYTDIVWAAANQPGGTWCQVFDASYPADWEAFHTLGCSALARIRSESFQGMVERYVEQGIIMRVDTLEELAEKLGFEGADAQTFLATVDRYNGLCDAGADADFGKPAYRLSEIREAPFYGVWLGCTLLTTCDGVKIDKDCRVLTPARTPIGGLYAAGDVAGSFFVNNYPHLFPGCACGHGMWEGWNAVNVIAGA